MDMNWIGEEIASSVIATLSSLATVAALGLALKFRKTWLTPLWYGITSGGVIFLCVLLATSMLTETQPRPYFTLKSAGMKKNAMPTDEEGSERFFVSVRNNDIPAENVVSHLLVISEKLDPNSGPIDSARLESANPVGPGGFHSALSSVFTVEPDTDPAFVVFQVGYNYTQKEFSQVLFFVFGGSNEDGVYDKELRHASRDEKEAIVRYMEKRGLSTEYFGETTAVQ